MTSRYMARIGGLVSLLAGDRLELVGDARQVRIEDLVGAVGVLLGRRFLPLDGGDERAVLALDVVTLGQRRESEGRGGESDGENGSEGAETNHSVHLGIAGSGPGIP